MKEVYKVKDKDDKEKLPRIVPCFFHFAQCMWRKANKLGLRKKENAKNSKNMILNIKILPFLPLQEVDDHFYMIYEEYEGKGKAFKEFLDYLIRNWLKGNKYPKEIWNYSKGV